jgi:hypothetical protein
MIGVPRCHIRTLHRVLDWRPREKKSIPAMETEERLPSDTRRVLDILCFVKNHILPFDTLEILLILDDLGRHPVGNQLAKQSHL